MGGIGLKLSPTKQASADFMGTIPMGKLLAKMSLPLMISMLIQATYNIVDSIFVSRLGMEAIAAVGVAFPIQMLMIALANGLGSGTNALISQRFGRGERDKVGGAAGNALVMAGIFMLLFMVFGFFGCETYLRAAKANPGIMDYGVDYLSVVCIGCGGIFYVILAERLLQVTGKTTLSMLTQLFGAVVNIILDPILIFGYFGAPAMGVRGAALATVIGQMLSLALGVTLNLCLNRELSIKRTDLRLDADFAAICRVGLPVTLTMGLGSLMLFVMNCLLAPFLDAVAIFSIYYKLQSFFFMPTAGMVQGLNPIIGYNYGAGKGQRLKEAIRLSALTALLIMLFSLLLCQLFPSAIIGLFDDGSQIGLRELGIRVLRILSLTFPLAGLSMVCSNLFQGMGTGLPGMIYALGRQCLFLLPIAFLILHVWGVDFVWYAFWVSETLTGFIAVLVFRAEYRKRVMPLLQKENTAASN